MPESPFLDGTKVQWAWDSTSLGWLKECPRKYQYHMLEGYVGRGESVHLEYGILYHEALEYYERVRATGMDHDDAVIVTVHNALERTWRDGKPWRGARDLPMDDKASLKNREYLIRTIVWYLDKFRDDPAKTVQGPDGPMVELHFQFDIGRGYNLCGYLDRIVEFQGEKFVMDRKTTTTTLGSYYFEQYDPDNQMSLYTIASQVAFHTPVKGVIIDAAQIAVGFSRFVRSFVFKTPDQIDEWMQDLRIYLNQAHAYAEDGYWPMNDKSCHKYGGCPFREICSKSPSVRDRFLESNFVRREWNPLISRKQGLRNEPVNS
jgi:PD-(D/E)XK nuclease superfamily protein